jgi:hypothetical protein
MKKNIIFVFIIFLLSSLLMSFSFANSQTLPTYKTIKQYSNNFNTTLENFSYKTSDKDNTTLAYIIIINNKDLDIKGYNINNNGVLNINVPENKCFIISLMSNRTITANWDFGVNKNNNLKFERDYLLNVNNPKNKSKQITYGFSDARHNFIFNTLIKGTGKIMMQYKHDKTHELFNNFDININVN